jgi:hypothetical protein
MPLSTIFKLYCGSQFYWWIKPEYPEKTTDLPQVFIFICKIEVYKIVALTISVDVLLKE